MAQQIKLILFISGIFICGSAGETCTLPSADGSEYGICEKWSQCGSAQNSYKNRNIAPVYCRYDSNDPVVCCASSVSNDAKEFEKYLQELRINERKCLEIHFPPPPPTTPAPPGKKKENLNRHFFVGGTRAAPEEFRHMAAIGWRKLAQNDEYEFLCGGTLISPYYVLTAAHCTNVRGELPVVVRIGGESLNISIQPTSIKQIHVHPEYRKKQTYNDIALLELEQPSFFRPACLWQKHEFQYLNATAVGYGHTTFGGKGSNDLIMGDLSLYTNEVCKQYYPPAYKLENGVVDSQLCAGDPAGMKDTCQGDSGGPLMVKVNISGKSIPYILGITSFGQGCAGGPPSIYTRVSSFLNWIEPIVWPETLLFV